MGAAGWTRAGKPLPSLESWAEHFRKLGYAALLVDSFGPRGEREICTQQDRRIAPQKERASDAHAALDWLAAQGGIRRDSIHLMGWSNGGTAALHALGPAAAGRAEGKPAFRTVIAFYPGCAQLLKGAFVPRAPLLILAGGTDDWTPAAKCVALQRRARGAHRAFDRISGDLRYRPDVRNPSSPTGWGAHVGPHPKARRMALERATAFLERHR